MSNEDQRNNWLKKFSDPKLLFGISVFFITIALGAPIIFTKVPPIITFNEKSGSIGDTFGMMNPFIAIAAAVITFAAFLIQYEANQEMRKDNKKQLIISHFYEMLKIHRDNVKEIKWVEKIHYTKDKIKQSLPKLPQAKDTIKESNEESAEESLQKNGKEIFFYFIKEFNITYDVFDNLYPELDLKEKVKKTFYMFYRGSEDKIFNIDITYAIEKGLKKNLGINQFKEYMKNEMKAINITDEQKQRILTAIEPLPLYRDFFSFAPPFYGRIDMLDNYYNQLYLTVKIIANEDDYALSFREKGELLSVLRSQLNLNEQALLFYSWFAGENKKWEEESKNGNHFFTQYRMIHNLLPGAFYPLYKIKSENTTSFDRFIDYFKNKLPIKEYCTKKDPMFDFEKIEGNPKFEYDR